MPTYAMKRGQRRWRGVVQENGVKRTKWFGPSREDERKAILWEEGTRKELIRANSFEPARDFTLADWHRLYLDDIELTKSKATYDEKLYSFDRFVDYFGDDTRVTAITPHIFSEYVKGQEKKRSGNSVNKVRKNLSAGWNWAKSFIDQWPINDAHPNPFLVVPRCKEERQERYVPPEEDFEAVYSCLEGQDRVILTTAYYLAARRGELWRLEWTKDIDLKGKRVRLGTTKTVDGHWKYVWLPMVKELHQALLEHCENSRTNAHDFVFWSHAKSLRHFGNPFVARNQWMRRLCKDAGVRPFGLHAIRHLRAIRLYQDNAPLGSIQKWLRHDRPSTTEVYLRKFGLDYDNLLEVAEASVRGRVVNIGKR